MGFWDSLAEIAMKTVEVVAEVALVVGPILLSPSDPGTGFGFDAADVYNIR